MMELVDYFEDTISKDMIFISPCVHPNLGYSLYSANEVSSAPHNHTRGCPGVGGIDHVNLCKYVDLLVDTCRDPDQGYECKLDLETGKNLFFRSGDANTLPTFNPCIYCNAFGLLEVCNFYKLEVLGFIGGRLDLDEL